MMYRSMRDAPSASFGFVASRLALEATCHSYHTDAHDINEEISTFSRLCGYWSSGPQCGLFYRYMSLGLTMGSSIHRVASRLMNKKII